MNGIDETNCFFTTMDYGLQTLWQHGFASARNVNYLFLVMLRCTYQYPMSLCPHIHPSFMRVNILQNLKILIVHQLFYCCMLQLILFHSLFSRISIILHWTRHNFTVSTKKNTSTSTEHLLQTVYKYSPISQWKTMIFF